ncbi:MAG: hypothetical protein FWG87_01765 [Defluviitaleaceae bacterium]|nr:hypothetical protein [Defluviitaleaceae bacterium]
MKRSDKKSADNKNKGLKLWEKMVKVAQLADKYHIPQFLIKFLFAVLKRCFFD